MHFEVAVGEYLPFLRLIVLSGRVYMSGPLAEAFHALSVQLNFTYTLHKVKGNSWGIHGPNGWTGMLGMVSRNEVDMAVGPFTMTYDRWSSFKLSYPLYADTVDILVPASEWKMTLFNVITVYSASVWVSIFVSLFSISLLMTIVEKYRMEDVSISRRFLHNLWVSLCTLLQKGGKGKSNHYLLSFLSMLWMFSALVLALVFGCVMLTRLFVRKIHKVDSLDDLIASPDIQPILESDSAVYGIFKKSQAEVYGAIFQRVTTNPEIGVQSYANMSSFGMDLVMSGTAAMITDGMGLKGFMAQRYKSGQPCNYWLAKETVITTWKVIAFNKNFPDVWIMKINKELRHSLESGWLSKRMKSEYREYEQCIFKGNHALTSLGLDHTKGIFLIWSLGCGAAIVVFITEYCSSYDKIENLGQRRKVLAHYRSARTSSSACADARTVKRKRIKVIENN